MADRLTEIEARAKAATPGPWELRKDTTGTHIWADGETTPNGFPSLVVRDEHLFTGNADFIAHAREDIPYLLATVKADQIGLSEAGAYEAEVIRLRAILASQPERVETRFKCGDTVEWFGHPAIIDAVTFRTGWDEPRYEIVVPSDENQRHYGILGQSLKGASD